MFVQPVSKLCALLNQGFRIRVRVSLADVDWRFGARNGCIEVGLAGVVDRISAAHVSESQRRVGPMRIDQGLDLLGPAHPRLGPDRLDPVGEARDEAEVFADMLLADPAGWDPELPLVSAVLVTHAHWDHVGGHPYLRRLKPDLKTYGRDNFKPVVRRVLRNHSYTYFRGTDCIFGSQRRAICA